MEQVASRPEHVQRAATFSAADLRAVASVVETVARDGVGPDDVLRAVDALLRVEGLTLWRSVAGLEGLLRPRDGKPPVHLARVEPRELHLALPVTGRRGRRPFVLVAWRRAAAPAFAAAERDLLDAVAPAVVAALTGRRPARPAVHQELVAALARARARADDPAPCPTPTTAALTPAEERVGTLVARGRSNGEVAFELGLSEHTVKQHLKSIFRKLGVRGRTELALRLARGHDAAG